LLWKNGLIVLQEASYYGREEKHEHHRDIYTKPQELSSSNWRRLMKKTKGFVEEITWWLNNLGLGRFNFRFIISCI